MENVVYRRWLAYVIGLHVMCSESDHSRVETRVDTAVHSLAHWPSQQRACSVYCTWRTLCEPTSSQLRHTGELAARHSHKEKDRQTGGQGEDWEETSSVGKYTRGLEREGERWEGDLCLRSSTVSWALLASSMTWALRSLVSVNRSSL